MLVLVLAGLVLLAGVAGTVAALLLSAAGGELWLSRRIERFVEGKTNGGDLRIGALSVDQRGLVLRDVRLYDASGAELLSARRLGAAVDLDALLGGRVVLPVVRADDVTVEITADGTGVTDWSRLLASGTPSPPSQGSSFELPVPVEVTALVVDGVDVRERTPLGTSFELAAGRLSATVRGRGHRVRLEHLVASGQLARPGPVPVLVRGDAAWDGVDGAILDHVELTVPRGHAVATGTVGDVMDLGVTVDPVEGTALAPLAADLGLGGTWSATAALRGPRSQTQVALTLRGLEGSRGTATVAGMVDLAGDVPSWSLVARLEELHVEDAYTALAGTPTVLQGTLRLEGHGTSPASDLGADGTWQARDLVVASLPIHSVDARFRVRGGQLEITRGAVDGILGAMEVGGALDLTGGGMAITVDSPLDPAYLAELGATGLGGDGALSAEITRAAGSSTVKVTGTVRYAPFRYGADVRLDRLRAPFHATVDGGRVQVALDLDAGGLSAYGFTGPDLRADDLRFVRAADGRISAGGDVDLDGLRYGDALAFTDVRASLSLGLRGSHRDLQATVATGPWQTVELPGTEGRLVAELHDQGATFRVRLDDGDRVALATSGSYALDEGELALDALTWRPTPRATWQSRGPVRARLVSGGVADLQLRLESDLGRVEARGDLSTTGPLDARIRIEDFQLDHLTELWPDRVDLAGQLDLDVRLAGTGRDPVVDGTVDAKGVFAMQSVRWLDVGGTFRWADGEVAPELSVAVAGEPLGYLRGTVPMTGGLSSPSPGLSSDVALSFALTPGDLARLTHLSPALEERGLPTGRASAVVALSGPLGDPSLHLAGVAEVGVQGWTAPARVELEADRVGDRLVFDGDLREDLALRALVNGDGLTRMKEAFASVWGTGPSVELSEPTLWLDQMDVSTALVGVPVSSLASTAGARVALGGQLVGGFRVTGSPTRPTVDGALNWIDGTLGNQAFEGAYLSLVPAAGAAGYDLDVEATFPDGGTFAVKGAVPVVVDLSQEPKDWSRGPLDVAVSGELPTSIVSSFGQGIRDAAGHLAISGEVGGTLDQPDPRLLVTTSDSELAYDPLGLVTRGVEARVELTHDQVTFHVDAPTAPEHPLQSGIGEALGEISGNPRVSVDGLVTLADWTPGEIDARIHLADGAWTSATDLTRLRWNGDLRVSGDLRQSPILAGDVTLVYGEVGLDAASFVGAAPLALDPTLSVVRQSAPTVAPTVQQPPFYANFKADVDVHLQRNLMLDMSIPFVDQLGELGAVLARMDVSTRLGGDVALHLANGEPTLVGEVDVLEGSVRTLRAVFDVDQGTLTFAGGDPEQDTALDLQATMNVSGGSLELHVTGTPASPQFEFHSEEFPDPNEQMVVLLTGTAPDELTSDEGAGAMALAMLLWSSVASGAHLGSISVEPNGAVRLNIPVSQSVHASSTWSVFSDPTENQVSFEIDWNVLKRLVLDAGVGNRIQSGNVYWQLRF